MTYELCEYSLIIPVWLSWPLAIIGVVALLLVIWRLLHVNFGVKFSWPDKSAKIGNVSPILLLLIALIFGVPGVLGLTANYHLPFAYALGSKFSFLVSRQDAAFDIDVNKEPLGEVTKRFDTDGRYTVRVTPAAAKVNLSGKFSGACDADLMNSVCRNASQNLSCKIDRKDKIFRVCARSEEAACEDLLK